jgi:hypothetical protein
MEMKIKLALLSMTALLNGCATASKSVFLGAAVGGLAGSTIGKNHSGDSQGTAVGAVLGAGIGSLISYFAYKDKNAKSSLEPKPKVEDDQFPYLTKPKIRSVIVPDTIEGNKYIKSHKVYILEDSGSWSKD